MHNLKTGDMCTPNWNTEIELEIMMIEGDKCTIKNDANLLSIVSLSDLKPIPPKAVKLSGEVPVPLKVSVVNIFGGDACDSLIRFTTEQDARDFSLHIKSLMQDQDL